MAAAPRLVNNKEHTMIYNPDTEKDLLYDSKFTRAFISLPTKTNVDFKYGDKPHRPPADKVLRSNGLTRKQMYNAPASSGLARLKSKNVTANTANSINDVRIVNALQETFKFYFKYTEPDGSKMRESIDFAINKINNDKIFVFNGNEMTYPAHADSFFSYFDQNLFGKKNLCIDGQNIGNSMTERTNKVRYFVKQPGSSDLVEKESVLQNLFFDTHSTTITSPLLSIKSFSNRDHKGDVKNIYGITYNVVCKLIDLLSGCQEELKFDNYVITMQRHSILDFFWSINTDPTNSDNERRVTLLETIGVSGIEAPICIKYEHGGKNIYFVSLPNAPISRFQGVVGTESDDYLAMLIGLRYRSKFFTRDKFRWLDGVILKRLFTKEAKYDYYSDNSLFIYNNLIQYELGQDNTINLNNLFSYRLGNLEEVPMNGIMYYPKIPSSYLPLSTNRRMIKVQQPHPNMNIQTYTYNKEDKYVKHINSIESELKKPLRDVRRIVLDYNSKITEFKKNKKEFKTNKKSEDELIREINTDSIIKKLDEVQFNRHLIDMGVIKEIFLILRRILREISDITKEQQPMLLELRRQVSISESSIPESSIQVSKQENELVPLIRQLSLPEKPKRRKGSRNTSMDPHSEEPGASQNEEPGASAMDVNKVDSLPKGGGKLKRTHKIKKTKRNNKSKIVKNSKKSKK
jgi:hypothetical protein